MEGSLVSLLDKEGMREDLWKGSTHGNDRTPDPLGPRGAPGGAVEQVDAFAEGTLREDRGGSDELEGQHLGVSVDGVGCECISGC